MEIKFQASFQLLRRLEGLRRVKGVRLAARGRRRVLRDDHEEWNDLLISSQLSSRRRRVGPRPESGNLSLKSGLSFGRPATPARYSSGYFAIGLEDLIARLRRARGVACNQR